MPLIAMLVLTGCAPVDTCPGGSNMEGDQCVLIQTDVEIPDISYGPQSELNIDDTSDSNRTNETTTALETNEENEDDGTQTDTQSSDADPSD